jgi:hypothetical protein
MANTESNLNRTGDKESPFCQTLLDEKYMRYIYIFALNCRFHLDNFISLTIIMVMPNSVLIMGLHRRIILI